MINKSQSEFWPAYVYIRSPLQSWQAGIVMKHAQQPRSYIIRSSSWGVTYRRKRPHLRESATAISNPYPQCITGAKTHSNTQTRISQSRWPNRPRKKAIELPAWDPVVSLHVKRAIKSPQTKARLIRKSTLKKHSNIIIATFWSNMVSFSLLVLLNSCFYERKYTEKHLTLTLQRSQFRSFVFKRHGDVTLRDFDRKNSCPASKARWNISPMIAT